MIDHRTVMGAVLAGGQSRRMGRDKALLAAGGGDSLVGRALGTLEGILPEVVLIAPRRRAYADLAVEIVPDLRPGLGPLGGLQAALASAAGRAVFVLACDLPLIGRRLVVQLLEAGLRPRRSDRPRSWRRDAAARLPSLGNRLQPLCGIYGGGCRSVVDRALDEGRLSVHELLLRLEVERLELDDTRPGYHPKLFLNINAPEDLAELGRLLARP